jgi:hypothetical protein
MSKLCRDGLRVVVARKSHAKMTGTLKVRGLGTTPMNLMQETLRARPRANACRKLFHVKQSTVRRLWRG